MSTRDLAAPIVVGAARVALGGLWLYEAIIKFRSGFGSADILLVANGAGSNARVPGYFQWFATSVMQPASGLFGFAIPLLEAGLGVALILGVLTRAAAIMSVVTLLLYWSSDQLTWEYPPMIGLAVVVIAFPFAARRLSLSLLLEHLLSRRRPDGLTVPSSLALWL
ncbi:DoxX family membrane protein [Leifsonia sp. fls2-241-R2A-40a]|uniref:DoxX family membrane protein n=1 Tax=Leifsonia sp. fls2-241-R2A-40a TaxID=3040290 RepID=UPI0025516408|nr:DoxX family membrane protein [Leifsonia sp. fls2-241-R2A-40a]